MPMEAVKNRADMEALLAEKLGKLQTDHIDFYLMHGINKEKWEYFKSIGAPEFFEEMKQAGKIRFKCFSFHGSCEDFEWDMVQIQYNYMDVENQAGTKGLELAGRLGIPVVIMEGLGRDHEVNTDHEMSRFLFPAEHRTGLQKWHPGTVGIREQ